VRHSIAWMLVVAISPIAAVAAGESATTALKEFQGEWKALDGNVNGTDIASGVLQDLKWQFKDRTIIAGRQSVASSFKIDPTKEPKEIDITDIDGEAKGKPYLGIYMFEWGRLIIFFAAPGTSRPKDFNTEPGENLSRFTLEKVKE
jgi:uncharacterized protein (TIGR03067 family)